MCVSSSGSSIAERVGDGLQLGRGGATYTYDNVGNRTAKTFVQQADPDPISVTASYSYDDIYQLTQSMVGGFLSETYDYDGVGNRTASLGVAPWLYNDSNHLTSTPLASFAYDNNGNMTSKTDFSGTTGYTWDFENRLTSMSLPGSGTVSFTYDPFGRRIRKVSASGTTIYAYDGDNVIEELDFSGSVVARYTQGLGIDEPLAMYRGGATHYYHADGLGSVTSLTDSSGTVQASYAYDSFGNLTDSTGELTNSFRYTAREFDSETGLYYYRARYYDTTVGRFLSEDPARYFGGRNFYVYTGSNPVNLLDPLGLRPCSIPGVHPDPKKRKAPQLSRCPSQSLVDCLIETESGGNPNAVSKKGARGKWQVMPIAIKELQQQSLIGETYELDEAGMLYLKLLLTFCDTTENAIAAYNAGPTAVNKAGGVPDIKETKGYVKKIGDCLEKKGVENRLGDPNVTECCQ